MEISPPSHGLAPRKGFTVTVCSYGGSRVTLPGLALMPKINSMEAAYGADRGKTISSYGGHLGRR